MLDKLFCMNQVWFNIIKPFTDRHRPLLISFSGSLCEAGAAGSVPADWDVEGRKQDPHPVQSQYLALVCISKPVLNRWAWLAMSVLFSACLWMCFSDQRSSLPSRWRRRTPLCSLGPTWIYTTRRRLLQNISLRYVSLKKLLSNNSPSFPFIKFTEPLELLSL